MAGDWIKMEHDLPDKPEVFSIAQSLEIEDRDLVVGKLHRVWTWFDKHTVDGNAHGVTLAFLDALSGVSGFAQAMQDVGWLQQRNGTLTAPKFDRHNSKSAKRRALGQERVKRFRNATSVTKSLPEKRREEKNIKTPPTPAQFSGVEASPRPSPREEGGVFLKTWEVAEDRLRRSGVMAREKAIAEAKKHGLSADEVHEIISEWSLNPDAWNATHLYYRIANGSPGQSPKDGWPSPSPSNLQSRGKAAKAAREVQSRAEHDAAKRQAEKDRERLAELESKYLPILRAKPKDEVRELLHAATNGNKLFMDLFKKNGLDAPLAMAQVYEHLESQEVIQ